MLALRPPVVIAFSDGSLGGLKENLKYLSMKEVLKEKLLEYIMNNNPDLLLSLQKEHYVNDYLDEKIESIHPMLSRLILEDAPRYIMEEICMEMLTRDLRPSRFNYIHTLLEEEFEPYFLRLQETGMLTYEIINLVNECKTEFDSFEYSEDYADKKKMRYFIMGTIQQYIESK